MMRKNTRRLAKPEAAVDIVKRTAFAAKHLKIFYDSMLREGSAGLLLIHWTCGQSYSENLFL